MRRSEARNDELRPLLVVLHADDRTKLDVVGGAWARVAEEAGADLLAPSGALPISSDPGRGMRWLEEPDDLLRRSAECTRRVLGDVREFLEHHPVDPERVWIAGEGTGAMVAFELALRAPGLFRGVVLVDGPIHPGTSVDQARRAASLGLRTALVLDAGVAERVKRWLADCGFADPAVGDREHPGEILRRWNAR